MPTMDRLSRSLVLVPLFCILCTPMNVMVRGDFMIAPGIERMVNSSELGSPARKALEAAEKAISEKNLPAARESLKPLESDPNVAHPEILLAELLTEAGFDADGRNVLEEFSGKEPERVDLYLVFAERAVKQQRWFDGWNLTTLGLRGTMPAHWSPAFRQHVSDRLQLLKAICSEGRKDWSGAKEGYSSIEQNTKNSIDILAGLGRCSFHLGETDAALRYFDNIKQLKPKSEPPYLLLAQLNDLVGKVDEAEAAYKKALETAEGTEKVAVRLAFARWLIVNNRPQSTTSLLTEPISDSPENETERQFLKALVSRMEGKFSDAQAVLSALHRQDPTRFVIANQLALVLCENADESLRARALQLAEGNVRNQSQSSEAWATLGWIQLQLGDRALAEKSLANAAQLGPLSRDTIYYILQLKRAAGDTNAATLLEKALEQAKGPNYFGKRP
jgi:Flp pilus assembly protein TadD